MPKPALFPGLPAMQQGNWVAAYASPPQGQAAVPPALVVFSKMSLSPCCEAG